MRCHGSSTCSLDASSTPPYWLRSKKRPAVLVAHGGHCSYAFVWSDISAQVLIFDGLSTWLSTCQKVQADPPHKAQAAAFCANLLLFPVCLLAHVLCTLLPQVWAR